MVFPKNPSLTDDQSIKTQQYKKDLTVPRVINIECNSQVVSEKKFEVFLHHMSRLRIKYRINKTPNKRNDNEQKSENKYSFGKNKITERKHLKQKMETSLTISTLVKYPDKSTSYTFCFSQ